MKLSNNPTDQHAIDILFSAGEDLKGSAENLVGMHMNENDWVLSDEVCRSLQHQFDDYLFFVVSENVERDIDTGNFMLSVNWLNVSDLLLSHFVAEYLPEHREATA